MSNDDHGYPALRKLGFAILAITVGPALFGFFALITWGVIAIPLIGLFLISPLVLIDYVVWRRKRRKQNVDKAGLANADASDPAR